MKIEEYLKQNKVSFTTHEHPPAYTAQEVAAEEHISGDIMAKAVVVRADGKHALCVIPASHKLDLKKAAAMLKAKNVRLADESDMAALFPGADVGAEPPFGNLFDLPTLVDKNLAAGEEIVFQAGTHRKVIRIKYADYEKLVQPTVGDLGVHL